MTVISRTLLVGFAALFGFMGWVHEGGAAPVRDIDLIAPAGPEWLHVNGTVQGTRYSTLSQINAVNVRQLKLAWLFSTGGDNFHQATPVYHDGIIYFPQSYSVFAIDARTGKRLWKFHQEPPEDMGGDNPDLLFGIHRGVALYGDNVYYLTQDNKLIALHQKTGAVVFETKPLRDYAKAYDKAEDANGYYSTVAPMAIPGKIIVPMNATDTGGLPGLVLAVHPESGEILWEANMIPKPGEPGSESWPGDSAKYGGAGPWLTGSWDPETKIYYTGTANAMPWNPYGRGDGKMDNLGAASIVAVNTDTGKVIWRYVVVPGDPFDYDVAQVPMIINVDGKKTIVQPNKTGFMHYLDPMTGQFLRAVRFADKITWAKGYDVEGRPVGQIALPKEGDPQIEIWPSLLGAVNLYPSAYNPNTGLIYMPARHKSMMYGFEKVKYRSQAANFGAVFEFPEGGNEINLAYDVLAGEEVWRDHKALDGYAGGMLTTAGNLVFYGSQSGVFHAVNAKTGEILYRFNMGTTFKAAPITFMLDGKQYISGLVGTIPGFGNEDHPLESGGLLYSFSR